MCGRTHPEVYNSNFQPGARNDRIEVCINVKNGPHYESVMGDAKNKLTRMRLTHGPYLDSEHSEHHRINDIFNCHHCFLKTLSMQLALINYSIIQCYRCLTGR